MNDLPGDNRAPTGRSYRAWVLGGFFAVAAVLMLAAVYWGSSGKQTELSVAKQWNEAIQKLGFEPVYPPVEDIAVGDVFAMITEDAVSDSVIEEPFAGRSIKLLHLDMTKEIEDSYRAVYQFPDTTPRPAHEGDVWPQATSSETLFKPPAARTALPLVLFPHFTIVNTRRAGGSAVMSRLLSAAFGAEAHSTETVEVRFSATETYGVPAVPAELRLIDLCGAPETKALCSDKGLRKQLSILIGRMIDDKVKDRKMEVERPRFSVELALVSRVFLARSIQTSIGEDSGTRGNASLNQEEAPPVAGAQPAPAPVDTSGSRAQPETRSQQSGPASTPRVDTNGAPGGAIRFDRRTASNVLLPDTLLPRPVVVGFKSIRLKPVE